MKYEATKIPDGSYLIRFFEPDREHEWFYSKSMIVTDLGDTLFGSGLIGGMPDRETLFKVKEDLFESASFLEFERRNGKEFRLVRIPLERFNGKDDGII